jgi:hypothetical protein
LIGVKASTKAAARPQTKHGAMRLAGHWKYLRKIDHRQGGDANVG